MNLGQKRDSMLAQASELRNEVKDKSNSVQVPPAKVSQVLTERWGGIKSISLCSRTSHVLL